MRLLELLGVVVAVGKTTVGRGVLALCCTKQPRNSLLVFIIIVELLTLAYPNLDFHVSARKIKRQRHKGKALLGHESVKLKNLLFVHKKLLISEGLAVEYVSFFISSPPALYYIPPRGICQEVILEKTGSSEPV